MLSPGDIVAVRSFTSEHALVNMMREVTRLPKDSLSFEAFVPWQNALPGDLLSGFTTFFNDETGGRLAANRAFNIELAARRIQAATIQYQESFSFNRLCGPYKKSNGYLMAPNISSDGKDMAAGYASFPQRCITQRSDCLYGLTNGRYIGKEELLIFRNTLMLRLARTVTWRSPTCCPMPSAWKR